MQTEQARKNVRDIETRISEYFAQTGSTKIGAIGSRSGCTTRACKRALRMLRAVYVER